MRNPYFLALLSHIFDFAQYLFYKMKREAEELSNLRLHIYQGE